MNKEEKEQQEIYRDRGRMHLFTYLYEIVAWAVRDTGTNLTKEQITDCINYALNKNTGFTSMYINAHRDHNFLVRLISDYEYDKEFNKKDEESRLDESVAFMSAILDEDVKKQLIIELIKI